MKVALAAGLCALYGLTAVAAPMPVKPAAGKDDGERLLGTWRCVKLVSDGREEPVTPPGIGDRSLMVYVTPGKLAFGQLDGKGGVNTGPPMSFTLDSVATPRRIDIGDKKGLKGIYSLDVDRLKLMHTLVRRGEDGSKRDRPEKFETNAGDGYVYMELVRVEP